MNLSFEARKSRPLPMPVKNLAVQKPFVLTNATIHRVAQRETPEAFVLRRFLRAILRREPIDAKPSCNPILKTTKAAPYYAQLSRILAREPRG